MLDNLGSRFQEIFKKVRGHGKLSERGKNVPFRSGC